MLCGDRLKRAVMNPAPTNPIVPPEQGSDPKSAAAALAPTTAADMATASLARRALCPRCIQLGGCELGIPGLIPVPRRGDIDPVTGKSKSYVESLIEVDQEGKAAVTGFQMLSGADHTRGETYMSGPGYCAALKRGQLRPEKEEKAP